MTDVTSNTAARAVAALPFRERLTRIVMHPVTLTVIVLGLLAAPAVMGNANVQILAFALVSIIFAQSLFVLTGLAGQISLGHAAFFGIGAYGSALLTKSLGLSLLVSVPGAAVAGALVAFLLSFPAGRVREVYLAMMTLGFGQIFFEVAREWTSLTGGVGGFSGIPSAGLRTLSVLGMKLEEGNFFRVLVIATVCVLLVVRNLSQSRFGRALCALHHSEFAAGSVGIARGSSRQFAYAVSGALAGLAGAFYAHLVGYIGPDSFGVSRSIDVLVVSIVGGMLSSAGQVVSALFFAFLPQRLQGFAEYQYIVYGVILAFSLIVLPKGVGGLLFSPPRFVRPGVLREVGDRSEDIATQAASQGGESLSVRDVTMRFGGLTALEKVSLEIKAGHITALVGPNGSGKSTLVNVISGIYRPTEGSVVLDGRDVTGMADYQMAAQGVVRTFQDPRLIPHFTVRENLMLGAHRSLRYGWIDAALSLPRARSAERRELARCNAVLTLLELDSLADVVVESLPYGHRRMAELGRMLLAGPRILMLDEPAAGLTEVEMARLSAVVMRLKAMGLSVLLIEHHMDFLANLVDDVVVLDSGHIIYRGDMEGMRKDPEVIAAYLGDEVTGHA
ncbi:ATP-binding cassette domain-containing protein [Caenimonas sp. SL110]|uniref:branched-chain amino acid ABC transporter ATP-binding protein/permease n=1 Tax=Caenimonas sp. SL110 TaxID=1450524 RepID=UPI0009E37812|nr:branched-chain amino acid ABC transporter ATP-binding protein/permease [Caenimonas sp. SL110]